MADDEGFREFVEARTPALSRAAYLLTGDHHLAQDLLQAALANTYQHWRRIRHGNPEGYVRRAMHHTHISWWRRRRPVEVDATFDQAAESDEADSAALRLTVVDALRVLTARQRAVVVLRYFDDLTEAQAADVLGCSVGTVKRLHFDALTRLRGTAAHLLRDSTDQPAPSERIPLR